MKARGRGAAAIGTLALIALGVCAPAAEEEITRGIAFWDVQRRGGNFFNEVETRARFRAAREAGLGWVRLVPDKWEGAGRDFLLGDADAFEGIVEEDLARLVEALDWAHAEGVPVVVGMLSLPGCRWVQLNDGKQDYRLWNEERFQEQAAAFWRELAAQLKDHPAVVAYNPLNEPHPARQDGHDGADAPGFAAWLEEHRGAPADLDSFNARMVAAIREVDPVTPILVEGYGHGSASGLRFLSPLDDPAVLYSFHFYEPWIYTSHRVNAGRYAYPGAMPREWDGPAEPWDRERLLAPLEQVEAWARRHAVSSERIVAAEFGCDRRVGGATAYLADLSSALDARGWHWAFYAFREDAWPAMDYELGTGPPPPGYWPAIERGDDPPRRSDTSAPWQVLRRALAGE